MNFLVNRAEKLPPSSPKTNLLRSLLGGTLAILVLEMLSQYTATHLIMAPFGATCVLLFAVSTSPLAQPRNVILGHFISAFVGLLFLKLFGISMFITALAVGVAIGLMQWLRCVHPPAGANPLVILLTANQVSYDWGFLLFPVLAGSISLVMIALVVNNIKAPVKWPNYWFALIKSKS